MRKDAAMMPTIGAIARRLDQPIWRVDYILRSRQIRPAARAGNARVFTEDDVDRIASELRHIDEKRRPNA